jgi:hypothetical protein
MGLFSQAHLFVFQEDGARSRVDLIYENIRNLFPGSYDESLPILVLRDLPIEFRGCRNVDGFARIDIEVSDNSLKHRELVALLYKVVEQLLAERLVDVVQFNLSVFQRLFGREVFLDGWQPYVRVIATQACTGRRVGTNRNLSDQSAGRVKWSFREARAQGTAQRPRSRNASTPNDSS